MYKSIAVAAALLASVAAITPAHAVDEINIGPGLTYAGAPLGLRGVDPVAFVERGTQATGDAGHAAVHDGVAYYFTSAANKAAFEKNPGHYVPQNGGFCTYGVAVGKKFDGDPRYAEVIDGKLYVFLNEAIFKKFQEDRAGTIAKAEGNWPKIRHTAAGAL